MAGRLRREQTKRWRREFDAGNAGGGRESSDINQRGGEIVWGRQAVGFNRAGCGRLRLDRSGVCRKRDPSLKLF